MTNPQRTRVAEIIAGMDGDGTWRGSGYRVAGDAVLTAAHVVAGARHVRVRFNADRPDEWSVPAHVAVADPVADIAVLTIVPPVPGHDLTPVLFGTVGTECAVALDCVAVGFPRFKLRDEPGETRYRDSHQANGTISPLSSWREGSLEIVAPAPALDWSPDHSPWEGMSGAAVWCKGRLIGVVSKHHPGDGPGRLAAARIDRLYSSPGHGSLTTVCELTGLPRRLDELVDVSSPSYAGVMECPYLGLRAFGPDDARLFFGRREVVAQLLESMATEPVVALIGASGSGKSSVLSAGLIPAASADLGYHCEVITPTADPVRTLEQAIASWSGAAASGLHDDAVGWVSEALARAPQLQRRPLLLIVDQMEELHTLCSDEQARRAFTKGLLTLIAGGDTHNRVVIGIRSDFYAQCADDTDLGPAIDGRQINLRAMSRDELRSMVEEPAARAGLHVDPRLTEMLLADVGDEPGKLPLLSHALLVTFERRQGPQLTVEDYIAAGRVQGAINKSADEAYESLTAQERDVAQAIFIRCAAGDGTIPDTRRPVRRIDLDAETFPGADAVLDRLAAARLITLTGEWAGEEPSGTRQQIVEVVHEAVIRSWGRLGGWLDSYRRYRPVHQDLIAAAGKWDVSGRPAGRLYHGANLEEARRLLTTDSPVRLTRTERDFLLASHTEAKRRSRRFRFLVSGAAALLLIAGILAAVSVNQNSQKDAQHTVAAARQLAGTSERLLSTDLPVAQLLAVQAYQMDRDPQTLEALFQAVTYSPALVRYLQAGSPVSAIGAAADGTSVIAGTSSGAVKRWDVAGGSGATIASLGTAITAVASDQGGTVVAAATASKVVIWTAGRGAHQVALPLTGSIRAVAVSPSGQYVAVAADGLTVYDRKNGTARAAPAVAPYAVAMPSDTQLVAADGGGPWQILSLPSLEDVLGPTRLSTGVSQVAQALSSSGRFVGYSNGGATIQIWDTAHTAGLDTPPDLTGLSHGTDPQALSISPDGKRIAVADGGTIYVSGTSAGTAGGSSQLALPGDSSTTAVQFLGDDDHLASAAGSSVALWNLSQPGRIGLSVAVKAPYACEACSPPQTDISPNGKLAATLAGTPSGIYIHAVSPGGPQYSFSGGILGSYQLLGWDSSSSTLFFMSQDGSTIEAAQISGLRIRLVGQWRVPPSDYEILAFSQAARQLIEISASGGIRVIPLDGDDRTITIPSPNHLSSDNLIGSAVDPTSSYVAEQFESDKAVEVDVKLVDLKTRHVRDLGASSTAAVAFSGNYLLVRRTDGSVEVWNTAGTALRYLIPGDRSDLPSSASTQTVPAVAGSFLVQERSDGTLPVTQLSTGTLLGNLPSPMSGPFLKTGLTPDGADQLVSVTQSAPLAAEAMLIRWNLSPQSWVHDACAAAGRSLTPADWQQYGNGGQMPDPPPCKTQ